MIGTGAIGMLSTYLLRLAGLDVWTAGRSPAGDPRPQLAAASGARYVSTATEPLASVRDEAGGFDLVVEATGDAQVMADSIALLRRNGVACLLGLDARRRPVELDGRVIGVDAVVENRVVFGSVNAHRVDWLAAVESLERIHERWPDEVQQFVGLRVPLDRFAEAFDHTGSRPRSCSSEPAVGRPRGRSRPKRLFDQSVRPWRKPYLATTQVPRNANSATTTAEGTVAVSPATPAACLPPP